MKEIQAISAVLIYLGLILFVYYTSKSNYYKNLNDGKAKLSNAKILIYSLMFTVFNCYITSFKAIDLSSADRFNYLQDFHGRKTGYWGFDLYLETIHKFTDNFNVVLYLTTFICCILMFWAYQKSSDSSHTSLLLLLSTRFIFDTFVNLKQCFACVFASIMFAVAMDKGKKTVTNHIIAVVCIVLACLFHSSGYVLIPLYLVFIKKRNIDFRLATIIVLFIILFLKPMSLIAADAIHGYAPVLSDKIYEYFSDDSVHDVERSGIVVIKGLRYYIPFILGLLKRKEIKNTNDRYDEYLLLLLLGCASYAATLVSYWMMRMIQILYFPICIAIYQTLDNEKKPKNRMMQYIIVEGSMIFFLLRSIYLNIVNFGGY